MVGKLGKIRFQWYNKHIRNNQVVNICEENVTTVSNYVKLRRSTGPI